MNLTKDTYEYLLNFADDRDIINMLSVNKKFSNEEFFKRVMERKYSDLIQYKKENETWKDLFVRMVYYISRLKEEYKVDYFPGLDPVFVFSGKYNPSYIILRDAAKVGNLEIIRSLEINPGHISFLPILRDATRSGQLNVVKYLLSQAPRHATFVRERAFSSGQLHIIKYLIDSGLVKE